MRRLRLNLHSKVLLTLLAVGLVPAAGAVALTVSELWKVVRTVSGNNLLTEARNVAGLLDREINSFISRAEATAAGHPLVAELFSRPDTSAATTTLTIAFSPLWQDTETSRPVFVLPLAGRLQSFVFPPGASAARQSDPLPYGFLEAQRLSFRPGLKAVSVHTDPTLRRPVALAWLPVAPPGAEGLSGWVGLEIPVEQILQAEAWRALFDVNQVCVLTSMGHVLGGRRLPDDRVALLQEELNRFAPGAEDWFETSFSGDERRLIGFSPLPLTRALRSIGRSDADWYVCIGRDLRPLAAAFRAQIARDLFAGMFLAVVLCVVAYFFARRLTRPIENLERGVRDLAGGNLTSRVTVQTGDELEGLARAFNEMAARLQTTVLDVQRQMATVQRQADELALLHDISRAINTRLDLGQTLATFAREISRLVAYDRLSVALLDDDGEHFTIQYVFPESAASEFGAGTRHRVEETHLAEAIHASRPIVRRNIGQSPLRDVDKFLASAGLRSVMIVPLVSESKAIGSVNLASLDPGAFGPEDEERMAVLAQPVAVAIQHSRLYMRVRRFAEDLEAEVRRRTAQLRRAQDKLVQTEKLAASGQLAAGIAHEINNPLGIIKNYLRLASVQLRQVPQPGASSLAEQHLQVIEEEINRIARIVQNLLDLYHPREYSPAPTDLHSLAERVLELFSPNWSKRGIQIVRRFTPSLPPLIVSPDRIRQVLINLLRNAEDAIRGKGTVTVSTRLEPARPAYGGESDSDRAVIEVEDTGCGIPRDALARVFDPFFTTKKGRTSTGLGLSVSYGICRSYGGTIDIESEPGRGTRVIVTLPVVGRTAVSSQGTTPGGAATSSGVSATDNPSPPRHAPRAE